MVNDTDWQPAFKDCKCAEVGIASACVLLGCYLYALKGIDLSIAYPVVTGFAMLGIALAGALMFGEVISYTRIVAMMLIVAGILLLKQSA